MTTKLEHHQQYLIEEFAEAYQEHRMERRELLKRVLILTGSVPMTASMLFALGCGDSADDEAAAPAAPPTNTPIALATTEAGVGPGVSPNDPAVVAQDITFKGPASDIKGYLARPAATGKFPAVLVIPENQGLLDHFKDLARRYAKEGFVALAYDPVSRAGGTTTDMAAVMAAYRSPTFLEDATADMKASLDYLKTQTFVQPNALAATGFCLGGNLAFEIALASPDIKAAAPYYGTVRQELFETLGRTQVAIIAFYGSDDARITAQAPMVEERLKASGKPYKVRIYEGTGHSFFNDTRPRSGNFGYVEASAKDAWKETLAWFRANLKA
jgi:carboxymethylenebutenolidase